MCMDRRSAEYNVQHSPFNKKNAYFYYYYSVLLITSQLELKNNILTGKQGDYMFKVLVKYKNKS